MYPSPARKSFFCCKNDHYSDQRSANVESRLAILKTNECCFKHMKPGHVKSNCRSNIKCFKCKMMDHHTALCNKSENKGSESITMLVRNQKASILLQTTHGLVSNTNESKIVVVRILFHSCSQRTHI